jgi:hypothetical protein
VTAISTATDEASRVLVMYAITLKNEPNQWRFFEIYASQAANIETPLISKNTKKDQHHGH